MTSRRLEPKSLPGAETGAEAPPNILGTIAHHPTLLAPFLQFSAKLAGGVLDRRDSELLALRAAWNCQSPFEWGHHVLYARSAGMTEDDIANIPAGPHGADWSEEDRLLLRVADELHQHHSLGDELWGALRARFDDAQLVEIPFVVGQYTMLSMVANATDVPLEPGLPALPGPPQAQPR